MALKSGGWKTQPAPLIVVDDQKAKLIGRNLIPQIGIKLVEEKSKYHQILNKIEGEKSKLIRKHWVKDNFTQVCIKFERAKNT